MIEFQDVSYAIEGRPLLEGVTFLVPEGARMGILGPNGIGKTTLLRLLSGQIQPDTGEVMARRGLRFGYLAQHPEFPPGTTVFAHVAEPPPAIREVAERLRELEARMEREADPQRLDRLVERHRELQGELEALGGYRFEGRAEGILASLGIPPGLFRREARSLSGGEKNRVALARILCESPQVLVLDEPTNYLDIEMIEWLEEFLRAAPLTVIASSHDRYFLNRIASSCLEIRDRKAHVYSGNYDAYARQREEEIAFDLKRHQKAEKEIARELEFIRRNFYGQRARQAKSREKRVARLQEEAPGAPRTRLEAPRMRFDQAQRGGEDVLTLEEADCGYGERTVLRGVSLSLTRGERVALLGANGSGKTTLLRCMAGEPPLGGEARRGVRTVPARFEQECAAMDSRRPLLDEVHDLVPRWNDQEVRDLLAAFLFRGDRIRTPIADLSGGEKAKLALLRLILSGANLLLLDEPTNHLDIHSRAALEEALGDFPETIVFVSHDRYFIERVADRVLYIEEGRVRELIGGYPEYREGLRGRRERRAKELDRMREAARAGQAAKKPPGARRRLDEKKLLEEIDSLEAALKDRQLEASRPEACRSSEWSRRLKKEMEDLGDRIGALYRQWEESLRGGDGP